MVLKLKAHTQKKIQIPPPTSRPAPTNNKKYYIYLRENQKEKKRKSLPDSTGRPSAERPLDSLVGTFDRSLSNAPQSCVFSAECQDQHRICKKREKNTV